MFRYFSLDSSYLMSVSPDVRLSRLPHILSAGSHAPFDVLGIWAGDILVVDHTSAAPINGSAVMCEMEYSAELIFFLASMRLTRDHIF